VRAMEFLAEIIIACAALGARLIVTISINV
jgi:hypothetical protein